MGKYPSRLQKWFANCKLIMCDQNSRDYGTDTNLSGKISAQPHPTLCIQFLDRKNNEENNTLPLGKHICFAIVWGMRKFPIYLSYSLIKFRDCNSMNSTENS